ncbi:MAG: proline racemase family protein [Anaerolineae bacterium]|jgi:proline racemase/trans-L-3-hydroxyproline dehydratase
MKRDLAAFSQFGKVFTTLDLHAGGEPVRLLIDGLPAIPGETINDKRLLLGERFDHVRLLLTREPRGHRDMLAAVVTDPVSDDGDFGIVFMDARRYPYMCGHGTIGAVTAFIEMGWLVADGPEAPRTEIPAMNVPVVVDSPSGPIVTRARVTRTEDGRPRVESVAIRLESAFAFLLDQSLQVPELGEIMVDVVFAGGFFVMVSNQELRRPVCSSPGRTKPLALRPENAPELIRLGMAITEAANQQLEVRHPTRPYIDTIDVVEFYDPRGDAEGRGKNAVIYGEAHIDRSACGTGTSAKMALLHRRGELGVGEMFINESPLGSTFEGRILKETSVASVPAIVPEIRGRAHVTGLHRFVVTPDDPFPEGFLI